MEELNSNNLPHETRECEENIQNNPIAKDNRKGKTITGFAREIIIKVAEICDEEAKNNYCKYPLTAPTKRASIYTGVSQRTIQRIRNEINSDESVAYKGSSDEESLYHTKKRTGKKGQVIPHSARNIIAKVIEACDKEFKDGKFFVPLLSRSKRTALYTGVSQRTVQRIRQEDEKRNKIDQNEILATPGKKRKRTTFNDKIDDFDFQSIRRLIDYQILIERVNLTCTGLHTALKEKIKFPYSEDTLYRLLHLKGFEWYKGLKGKKMLIEKPEIVKERLNYLQQIKNHEKSGKFIIYLDDKWIGVDQIDEYISCNKIFGCVGGICCSGRLVILNEFSAMGFVSKAKKLYKPNTDNSFSTPNVDRVEQWLKEKFFPSIPSNSLIIMSSDSNHERLKDIPNEYSTKPNLIEYLKKKNLPYNSHQTCSELLRIIKNHLETSPARQRHIDVIIERYGHAVLRLPLYMSEFSPIELAWADIKRFVRDKQSSSGYSGLKSVQEVTLQAVESFQAETLQGYVDHVIQIEDYFCERRNLMLEHYNVSDMTPKVNYETEIKTVNLPVSSGDNYDIGLNKISHSSMPINEISCLSDSRNVVNSTDGSFLLVQSVEADVNQSGPSYLCL
ncbi:uncharacterized protein LOC115882024 [Sitophilus oryzae]|uniref:Uncharacterized protein LOC115882024 n=1 Tax=Sitophilus oryzae TaxID=7048 RepID=A0A6J2XY69_SITOR|nr:uncharacterized protein LOC115882024 [Sitophilus oryzae]